jgi:hypothetical protein
MRPEETAAPAELTNGTDDKGIGARVASVFTAAEKAAEHIMALAREEADDLRRRTQVEVDTYRQECRNAAEQEAQRIIAEAHTRADELQRQARSAGAEIERVARERRARIVEEMHLIEERVSWAREGLGDVLARLEQVATPEVAADPEEPSA